MAMGADRNQGSIVYIGCAGSNAIEVLQLDQRGNLTLLTTAALPDADTAGPSLPLAVSPDRRFLFAGIRAEPYRAVSFAIDPATGGLTAVASAPLADSMAYLATDRTGRFLLSASYGGSKVAVNPIAPDGRLGPPQSVLPTAPKAHAILPGPSNTTVFATSLGGDLIHRFAFDAATGTLSPAPLPAARTRPGSGPRHFVLHPNAPVLFLLNELDATIDVFATNADEGEFRPIQTIAILPDGFQGKPWAADIHGTPDGTLLYCSERTSSTLMGYRIDQERGILSPCGSTPTETQPRDFAIDPSGRFLVAAGETSNGATSYEIDPASGRLRAVARVETGAKPNWVEIVNLP
jgi:6-phosphogluconolactonase